MKILIGIQNFQDLLNFVEIQKTGQLGHGIDGLSRQYICGAVRVGGVKSPMVEGTSGLFGLLLT